MPPPPLTAHDAEQPPPDWARMLRRGLIKRCPRCGGGRLFRTWWSIRDRCPTCGLRFAREEGYFTGVYLVNFAFVLTVLFLYSMGFAIWIGSNPGASLVPVLVVGVVIAIVLPVGFYPFARTLWAALDLAMTPMELDEILEAAEATDEAAEASDDAAEASDDATEATDEAGEGGGARDEPAGPDAPSEG